MESSHAALTKTLIQPSQRRAAMPYIENFSEFKDRMACTCVTTARGYLFEIGGFSNGQQHEDPPDDAEARLRLQIEYQEFRLQHEEQRFHECQAYITGQSEIHASGAGPMPDDEA